MNNKLILPLVFASAQPAIGIAESRQLQRQDSRPNIILFLVDDMGWQETSVPFYKETSDLNRRYRTPNMERMAAMGVKFTNAYACAISSPSRCSLLTGMNAARHRVTNWTLEYDTKTDYPGGELILPDWNYNGLQPDTVTSAKDRKNTVLATTLPQILKDNGYYTIHCGKAHFGAMETSGANPESFGFDVNIAGAANGAPGSYLAENEYGTGSFHVIGLEKYYNSGVFLTEALTREALQAIQTPIERKQPFFLYLAHYAIHAPYKDADSRFAGNYLQPDGTGIYDTFIGENLNSNEINHAALVEGMDKSLGDVLDFLEKDSVLAKNTIVVFMSDNGGQGVGPRQGRLNRDQNFPARAGKGSAYDGGVHEPMMVYWPGVTIPNSVNSNPIMIEDFFPTILDMAIVNDYTTSQHVDGVSFVELLQQQDLKRSRSIVWHYPNRWGESTDRSEGYGAYSSILDNGYKLIYFWEDGEKRLYNLANDPSEQHDLAADMPEKVCSLSVMLTNYLKDCNAQRPSRKSTSALAPWPDEVLTRISAKTQKRK